MKKKLIRKGIKIYAYCWIRDVGDIDYQKHIHLIIVINRINGVIFKSLFEKKLDNNYKVEFCKSLKGTIKYITNKPLFGKLNQATYHLTKLQVPKAT